jgi:hypothetical protein
LATTLPKGTLGAPAGPLNNAGPGAAGSTGGMSGIAQAVVRSP